MNFSKLFESKCSKYLRPDAQQESAQRIVDVITNGHPQRSGFANQVYRKLKYPVTGTSGSTDQVQLQINTAQ